MSGPSTPDDSQPSAPDEKQSFWTTTRGILTAAAGVIGAAATLIGALTAASIIGNDDGTPSPTTSPTPSVRALDEAVVRGQYDVVVQVRQLVGAENLGENKMWSFANPHLYQRDEETWTLTSTCQDRPCSVTWGSASDDLSGKFRTLQPDGEMYRAKEVGTAKCGITLTAVDRRLTLEVTDATIVEGVWTATRLAGTIRISWNCNGVPVSAVLSADATTHEL